MNHFNQPQIYGVSFCFMEELFLCLRQVISFPYTPSIFSEWIENRQINKQFAQHYCWHVVKTDKRALYFSLESVGAAIQPVHIQDSTENMLIFKHMVKPPWFPSASLTATSALDKASVPLEYLMPFLKLSQE